MKVRPAVRSGALRTRGSTMRGGAMSSSRETQSAAEIGSSSSRLGLRWPCSSRESVLVEIPVSAESLVNETF